LGLRGNEHNKEEKYDRDCAVCRQHVWGRAHLTFPILRLVIVNRASCEERIAAAGAFSLSKRADANMRARGVTSELAANHFPFVICLVSFFIYLSAHTRKPVDNPSVSRGKEFFR
jgi:hypothetical protein